MTFTRPAPDYVLATPQVGEDGQHAAIDIIGRRQIQLGQDAADVLAHRGLENGYDATASRRTRGGNPAGSRAAGRPSYTVLGIS